VIDNGFGMGVDRNETRFQAPKILEPKYVLSRQRVVVILCKGDLGDRLHPILSAWPTGYTVVTSQHVYYVAYMRVKPQPSQAKNVLGVIMIRLQYDDLKNDSMIVNLGAAVIQTNEVTGKLLVQDKTVPYGTPCEGQSQK
jgi:hypothetical protein